MMTMPAAYPEEFRKDVVRVARKGEVPLTQIAKGVGIAEGTLSNWLKRADIDDGIRSGVTTTEAAELREVKKRYERNRICNSTGVATSSAATSTASDSVTF
jgi:transposase